jgi:hypothetical protein
MKALSFDLNRFKEPKEPEVKSKITNQRQELVKKFLDKLNESRTGKYKPLSPAYVGMKMRFMDEGELYRFYGFCADSQNFSSTWFWSLNPKNYEK